MEITALDKKIIKALQEDLPLSEEPFREIANTLQIDEKELLNKIQYYIDEGIIRRFGAVIRHRKTGFTANAMVVWKADPDKTKEIGKKMAEFPEVSHCYERPVYPEWPYNLFTMVHGRSKQDCYEIAQRIGETVDIHEYSLLFSSEELKKTSMKYFMDEN
ncbi:MAG: Lrp/AsnC family transcriptional regulator [Clostridiaceae bacterium]|nr:Lrp/AsnC family transcriptional regulator [Clostridiaceae bacterium]